jgi:hypothetical protein
MSMRSSTMRPSHATRAVLAAAALLAALACAKSAKPPEPAAAPSPIAAAPATTAPAPTPRAATSEELGALGPAAPFLASLTSAVPGLSSGQAALGTGALLALAQTKMPAGEYDQVIAAVPGAAAMVAAVQDRGLPSAASLSSSTVTEYLGKSGISPDQVAKLTSALGTTVGGMVPGNVASSFTSALK